MNERSSTRKWITKQKLKNATGKENKEVRSVNVTLAIFDEFYSFQNLNKLPNNNY